MDTPPGHVPRTAMTALDDLTETARNVLVLAPTHGGYWQDACTHLSTRNDLDGGNVLVLTYVLGADAHLARLEDRATPPRAVAIVEATGDATTTLAFDPDYPVALRQEAPGDLTGLGIQCSEFLTRWHDSGDVAVCIESISAMLQYTPMKTAYRFLHVLTHRVNHAGATAHYHMSPDAHSRQEIGTLKQLFDAVASFDQDADTWNVLER